MPAYRINMISNRNKKLKRIRRERPGLMASRFMAEWRNMTGEDSATQVMLLAMWAHPSPANIEVNIYFSSE